MNLIDGSYAVKKSISKMFPINDDYWKRIKMDMLYQVGDVILPEIADSGKYHVLKMSFFLDDRIDVWDYYLKLSHSIAQESHLTIPVIDEFQIPISAREICRWCGNVLILDKRGGCSACGGWVGNATSA